MDPRTKKLLRAALWFLAAGLFIFALLNTDREAFEARHGQPETEQQITE